MNIVQLTPGAGAMYCGNCLRDNALTAGLRRLGHQVTMVPLYLPLTLDEPDQSAGTAIFFGGVSVYLEEKLPWFRGAPAWVHALLARPALLRWAGGRAAQTLPEQVGDLTLSMLRGEAGNQERELRHLLDWLKTQRRADVICLSNALLVGMARRLKAELRAPVVCNLQGEDAFLDALPARVRDLCWQTVSERSREIDCFIAPSRYFADRMTSRLSLPPEKVHVVFNGITLEGYRSPTATGNGEPSPGKPVLGFFARMCREKGLDTLVDAFIRIHQRVQVPGLRLKVGGSCGPADEPVVDAQRDKLRKAGLLEAAEFCPNLTRAQKIAFLNSLTVFSVPALYGEAFGLYVVEALAAGVPVVQPRTASFPELVQSTGGGLLCDPGSAEALAVRIEELLLDSELRFRLARAGQQAAWRDFSAQAMAERMEIVFRGLVQPLNATREKGAV